MKKFNRLVISLIVLIEYMTKISKNGENPAYVSEMFPNAVFLEYFEKGESFFTIISTEDYEKIRNEYWSGTNNYVMTCRNGKTVYLHRELCPNLQPGQYAHHKGCKFDNRAHMLQAVTPIQHDQHRTYCGDMVIKVKNGNIVIEPT